MVYQLLLVGMWEMRIFVSSTSLQRRALQFERGPKHVSRVSDIYICSDIDMYMVRFIIIMYIIKAKGIYIYIFRI